MSRSRLLVVIALVLTVVTLLPVPIAWRIAQLPVAVLCLCLAHLM